MKPHFSQDSTSERNLFSDSSGTETSPITGDGDSDSGGSLVPYSFEPSDSEASSDSGSDHDDDGDDDDRLSTLTW